MTNGHFTKPIKWKPRKAHRVKWKPQKAHRGKTEIVTGPPVKITRARDGSRGKDVEVELVKKPEEGNWLDENELNDPGALHGRQSGYGKWVERVAEPLKQIGAAEDASPLPEMLASEEVVVQNAAEKKLRKLEDKKEAPKTRFDIIDIPDEEKGDKK